VTVIDWTIVASFAVPVLALCGTWLTVRIQHRGKPENALIDQMQEEMKAMREDIAGLKTEQAKSKRRERIRDDYINKLRRHIEESKPPPAPEWPDGLYD